MGQGQENGSLLQACPEVLCAHEGLGPEFPRGKAKRAPWRLASCERGLGTAVGLGKRGEWLRSPQEAALPPVCPEHDMVHEAGLGHLCLLCVCFFSVFIGLIYSVDLQ